MSFSSRKEKKKKSEHPTNQKTFQLNDLTKMRSESVKETGTAMN